MELLAKLYNIHSKSGNERMMTEFVAKCCANLGAKTRIDEHGNVLAVKGSNDTYPCVVAHLDQVQSHHSPDFRLKMQGDVIYAFSESYRSQQGLGADDKNGVWVALKALARFDTLKVAFFTGEEVGCVGSSAVDMDFFSDCRFVLQCDRKGSSDFITTASCVELCGDDFVEAAGIGNFGYKTASGLMTDVMSLKERGLGVACCNISCGYYNAHTDNEVTVVSELKNCFELVCSIIEKCTDVYPHEYVDKYAGYKGYNCRSFLGDDYYYKHQSCNGTISLQEDDDENLEETDLVYDIYEQLGWCPDMRFKFYWKYYGKFWGIRKKRTKEIFDRVKDEVMATMV